MVPFPVTLRPHPLLAAPPPRSTTSLLHAVPTSGRICVPVYVRRHGNEVGYVEFQEWILRTVIAKIQKFPLRQECQECWQGRERRVNLLSGGKPEKPCP